MKNKITKKEFAAYFPYGLMCEVKNREVVQTDMVMAIYEDDTVCFPNIIESVRGFSEVKPILRDLSDLTKEIEHNGEKFVPSDVTNTDFSKYSEIDYEYMPYNIVRQLVEWHFNVFQIPDELIVRVTEYFNPYK